MFLGVRCLHNETCHCLGAIGVPNVVGCASANAVVREYIVDCNRTDWGHIEARTTSAVFAQRDRSCCLMVGYCESSEQPMAQVGIMLAVLLCMW